jgi:hypothetical protein
MLPNQCPAGRNDRVLIAEISKVMWDQYNSIWSRLENMPSPSRRQIGARSKFMIT